MIITEQKAIEKIDELEKNGYEWFPLGGKANNSGIINMTMDPTAALVERITNSIDTVLESKYKQEYGQIRSPKKLAEVVKQNEGSDAFDRKVIVSINKSESLELNRSMTIIVEDYGTGIEEGKMSSTILELNGSNKVSKRYVMGAYGQGGSTSIKFNRFTAIYTKSNDEVMTIIRFNKGGEDDKNGSYEYIAKKEGNNISFNKSNELSHTGTAVSNIAMNYEKTGKIRQQTNSIYTSLTNRLFNPPFSISLVDNRYEDINVVKGAHIRLDNYIKDELNKYESEIRTSVGSIIPFKWWIIMPTGIERDRSNEIYKYYLKDARLPFNIIVNGQTQGYLTAKLLENSGLSFLKKRFICELDLSNISKDERNSIITSTRETLVETSTFRSELERLIENEIRYSARLQEANKIIRESLVSTSLDSQEFNKKLNDALKKMVASFTRGQVSSTREISLLEVENSGADNEDPKDEIELKETPSFFSVIEKKFKEFSGDELSIRYKTDGFKDIVIPNIEISFGAEGKLELLKISQSKGSGIISFRTENMKIGDKQKIELAFLDLCKDEILVKKIDAKDENRKSGFPKVSLHFIDKESNPLYAEKGFNKPIPMIPEYNKLNSELDIYINLATFGYIDRKFLVDGDEMENFKNDYALAFAFYVISQIEDEEYDSDIDYDYKHLAKQAIHNFQEKLKLLKH